MFINIITTYHISSSHSCFTKSLLPTISSSHSFLKNRNNLQSLYLINFKEIITVNTSSPHPCHTQNKITKQQTRKQSKQSTTTKNNKQQPYKSFTFNNTVLAFHSSDNDIFRSMLVKKSLYVSPNPLHITILLIRPYQVIHIFNKRCPNKLL